KVQNNLWQNELSDTERQGIISKMRAESGSGSMSEVEAMREYFAQAIANQSRYPKSDIQLTKKMQERLGPLIEKSLKDLKIK
ncbi:MAG: hypothetical protein AAB657_01035, partial [Patescibacteria group bacterium]